MTCARDSTALPKVPGENPVCNKLFVSMPEVRAAAQRSPGQHIKTAMCGAGPLALECCHLPAAHREQFRLVQAQP